jgi:hypothetical protein
MFMATVMAMVTVIVDRWRYSNLKRQNCNATETLLADTIVS